MLRVILVEQDDTIRAAATAALMDRGHQAIALPYAMDAIRLMPFIAVDAIVAETTPAGAPFLAEQVRRLHPGARIILTSTRVGPGLFVFRARSEGWHLLTRPYRVEQVLALLK